MHFKKRKGNKIMNSKIKNKTKQNPAFTRTPCALRKWLRKQGKHQQAMAS